MYPQVFGKYVLERELSRGGMARVLLATLRGAGGFEKRLVVKQIRDELAYDSQFVRRFVEEAKTTVALSHPNIVPVYELGIEQGTYFLAMELVEGLSVADLLRDRFDDGARRVLTPDEGAYIGIEVCRALDYAHRRMKVVHRDITPRNVMIDDEGQVKLIDFGIAAPALVAGHDVLGSPGHMPPEQVEGKELGPPTDIFAVAVLLMEAWTGVAPFRRGTPEECDVAMREPHPRPSDFDPRLIPLDDAIRRAMHIEPSQRQQEASELARELRAFVQGIDVADVARALGHRVAASRAAAAERELEATSDRDPETGEPHAQVERGTETFAQRDSVVHWSSHPPAVAPSTRRLPDATPSALDDEKLPPAPLDTPRRRGRADDPAMMIRTPLMVQPIGTIEQAALEKAARDASEATPTTDRTDRAKRNGSPRTRGDDPAMMVPTPLMILSSELPRVARSLPSSRPPDRLETIATRPLERSVGEEEAKKKRLWGAIAVVTLIVLAAMAGWRSRDQSPAGGAPSSPRENRENRENPSAPVPTAPVSVAAPSPPASAILSAPTSSSAPPSPASPATAPIQATSSAVAAVPSVEHDGRQAGRALVSFLGDPGTRVSVDGIARGTCPTRVALDSGQHDVRFTFEPTGESRGERFSVKPNERVTVRADFTATTPTVRIQR